MGERGPRPAPSAHKRAAGVRSDRINHLEPRPSVPLEAPPAPEHLDDTARELWDRLAPDLHRAGVLTPWDLELFCRYCELESIVRAQWDYLRISGAVIGGRRDGFVVNPCWRVYRDAIEEQRRLAHEFGLTPSGRSGIRVPGGPPASPDD